MPNFDTFRDAVHVQFTKMAKLELFQTEVDKDKLWETYLASFPAGTNPIYKERTKHDCTCCKQFIRACGSVVAVVDNKLVSIWDIEVDGFFQEVANAMSALVKSYLIKNLYLHDVRALGNKATHQELEGGEVLTWSHFYFKLPTKFIATGDTLGSKLSEARSTKDVFKRGVSEISDTSIAIVIELIKQKAIYRGEEFLGIVKAFAEEKAVFNMISNLVERDIFCWLRSMSIGGAAARVRNTSIGTLLVDLSSGMELDAAVRLFESKVAPSNYKRPTSIITKSMIEKAEKTVNELGIGASLQRRYAIMEDINATNILFANRSAKKIMNPFEELKHEVPTNIKSLNKVTEIGIEEFISTVLPKVNSVELMFENTHENNLVSLIAPTDLTAPNIFKWANNYTWSYANEVTDSIKTRVKAAGGDVGGVLRFSIQWNEKKDNQDDLDAHCLEPTGGLIHYRNKGCRHESSGMLDVDIQDPGQNIAVENITYNNKSKMPEGDYSFMVHNYSKHGGKSGFTAEIEFDGKIQTFYYPKPLRSSQKVKVAIINLSASGVFSVGKSLPEANASKELWNIPTHQFHKVSVMMHSPNHWDEQGVGNKHFFFMLEGCKNDEPSRGFYNEFLDERLSEHRKVFEMLGSKMKTAPSENQLSGLGFSSTQRNHVFAKVEGTFSQTLKILF